MSKSVLGRIKLCKVCKTSYLPENGETCECPEEPRIRYGDASSYVETSKQEKWSDAYER